MGGPGLAGWKMAMDFKGSYFEHEIVLWGVRWYVAYPISYRQLEEMMGEHGVEVDHSTLNRWILKYVPLLEKEFATYTRPVGNSWRLDETYVRTKLEFGHFHRRGMPCAECGVPGKEVGQDLVPAELNLT
jgi:putative transposase